MVSAMILARENRVMINAIKKDVNDIKKGIDELSNHYSKRLPIWATILFTLLCGLVTGLVVHSLK